MKKITFLILFVMGMSIAQNTIGFKVHSHNNYLQNGSFWKTYTACATSIDADGFIVGDSLYLAHVKNKIDSRRSMGNLYLDSLKKTFALDFCPPTSIKLKIDIKSNLHDTLTYHHLNANCNETKLWF